MKKIKLNRLISNGSYTVGYIVIKLNDKKETLYTLELPYKNNERNISCIPKGLYALSVYSSPKFQTALKIHDVLNRSGILIHPLNTLKETKGCIGLGLRMTMRNKKFAQEENKLEVEIRDSRKAVNLLINYVETEKIKYIEIL